MGPDGMIFVFWMLNFKLAFLLSCFTLIKRLFSFSSFSAIRMISPAYRSLLIFLPAILIPACDFSSLTFWMMYSAYKLNKQGDNIQPCRTPFPILNQFLAPCSVLTVVSWPAYKWVDGLVLTQEKPGPSSPKPTGVFKQITEQIPRIWKALILFSCMTLYSHTSPLLDCIFKFLGDFWDAGVHGYIWHHVGPKQALWLACVLCKGNSRAFISDLWNSFAFSMI